MYAEITSFSFLAYITWIGRIARREYRRLEHLDTIAEGNRIRELRALAAQLGFLYPDHFPRDEVERFFGGSGERRSLRIVERLLDRFDHAVADGLVIGRYSAETKVGWPWAASHHAVRGHDPSRTIDEKHIPIILPDAHRDRHLYGIGKTNTGKTTLLRNLVLQDLRRGAGVGVIAPEAELFLEELLPYIPEDRLHDVIYVDPSDTERPVPLNPLLVEEGEDFDRKLDETLSTFHRLIAEDGTSAPRMEMILRFTLLTLMSIPGSTLLDVPRLLDRTDDGFRRAAVERIASEEARHFWTSVYPLYPKDAHLSLLNRLGRFLQPKVVRNMLCQPNGSLNIRKAMDEGKIVLFNLSDGILGERNAQILGQLIVTKIQMAAMSRADVPKESRRPFHLYIDEFQSFCGVAGKSYEKILSRARKYRLRLTLLHQQTGQIPEPVMREILGNVGSLIVFQVGATDAHRLGRELKGAAPAFDHARLMRLPVGVAYCLTGGRLHQVRTSPPPPGGSERIRDEAIRRSRERYGREPGPASGPSPFDGLEPGDVF